MISIRDADAQRLREIHTLLSANVVPTTGQIARARKLVETIQSNIHELSQEQTYPAPIIAAKV